MKKSVLLIGAEFIIVCLVTVISLYTSKVNEVQMSTMGTQDSKVVKTAHQVEQVQLANTAKDKKVDKNKKNGKLDKKKTKKEKNSLKKTSKYKLAGTFKVTAYCNCSACCGKSTGITASGTHATAGRTIAADTSKFSFGTKLKIGDHIYTVEDRGSAINGNKIDVYFDSHSAALQWGVKYCEVYVQR